MKGRNIPWPDQATNPLPVWARRIIYSTDKPDPVTGKLIRYRDKKGTLGKSIFRKKINGFENWVTHIRGILNDKNRTWLWGKSGAEPPKPKPKPKAKPLSRRVVAPPQHVPGAVPMASRLHYPTAGAHAALPRRRKKKKQPVGSPGPDQPRLALKKGQVMSVSRGAARRKSRTDQASRKSRSRS